MTVCQKISGSEKFPNTKFTRQKLHISGTTDARLSLSFHFLKPMSAVYTCVCQDSWYQNPSFYTMYTWKATHTWRCFPLASKVTRHAAIGFPVPQSFQTRNLHTEHCPSHYDTQAPVFKTLNSLKESKQITSVGVFSYWRLAE